MNILALSGSLRLGSSNAALIHACVPLAPAGMTITLYDGLGTLPHFNPDLDREGTAPPAAVATLREALLHADGVVISSPEYAHGVPGSLKNALDWLVSVGELVNTPVLLLNAAPQGGEFAQAAIAETLRIMNWALLSKASLTSPFLRQKPRQGGELDEGAARAIRLTLEALATAVLNRPPRSDSLVSA